nr:glycosyltransferase [Anaerolineae bacterium]
MKLALVHDWLNQIGGAENVLEQMVDLFGIDTPVYTSIYDPVRMPDFYREWDIRTTWMDNLPAIHAYHQPYLPVYPMAWQGLDLSGYDLVLSNKSGFCHGVNTGETHHLCYCLTPTRYLWQFQNYVQRERLSATTAAILRPVIRMMRRWDYQAAQRVGQFVAISTAIQARIKQFYHRESVVIYPPVDTHRFEPTAAHEDYFLVVSRLVPYKRVDLAVQACTRLDKPLIVVGDGRDRAELERKAGATVTFLGRVPEDDLPDLVSRCKAFLFPGLEDFGIAPVEAQAAGRPVIAFKGGGALDTVIDGETGVFFAEQSVESLLDAMRRFEQVSFDPVACRRNAERFDTALFRSQLAEFVQVEYDRHVSGAG